MIFGRAWPDIAGQYRQVEIDAFAPIGDLPPHPNEIPELMYEFGRDLRSQTSDEPSEAREAVVLAVWAHMELVAIHPFQDGNGKTARLLMDVILMRHITGPTLPLDISDRDRYVRCVQAARKGRTEPFHDLIADVLEQMAEEEASRPGFIPFWLWRRLSKH